MTAEVVITGYGVFTAFGFGAEPLLAEVFAGRPGFGVVDRFDVTRFRGKHAATHAGAAGLSQREVLRRCAQSALDMAEVSRPDLLPLLVGTKGDFATINKFWSGEEQDGPPRDSVPASLVHDLGAELGLGHPRLAFANACVASTNAIAHGAALIRAGHAESVVCGGVYLVDQEVFAKFDGMYAFARDGQVRPFAKRRSGLLLGDGAAALVLESGDRARERGATPLAAIAGAGMASDAYHVVQPHPRGRGMARAFTNALAAAGIPAERVGYVNAHGTGTRTNDVAETAAIRTALGAHADRVAVSSTKSTTGHPLEASGAVQAVIGMLAMRHGVLPPTAGYAEPDPECDLDCVPNEPREADVSTVVTMSAAFGGLNAALVLERR